MRTIAHRHIVGTSAGLACWLSTLLLYSHTITPFQRLAGTSTFVGTFAVRALALAAVVAIALGLASLFGRHISTNVLGICGGGLYVLAAGSFVWVSLSGLSAENLWATWPMAAATALGSAGTGLLWGRVCKRLSPRQSLLCIALAAGLSATLGVLFVHASDAVLAAAFPISAAVAAFLPLALDAKTPGREVLLNPSSLHRRPLGERLGSLSSVAGPAFVGLLAFAFVVGTMRELIVESHSVNLGVLVLCSLVLAVIAHSQANRPLAQTIYRKLIPMLAVLLLAVTNITSALHAGSWVDALMIFSLYTFAALLTLATLSAIAHAEEFPCDLIFAIALTLFCLASYAGLKCAEVMTAEAIKVSTTVITTVYAFAIVVLASLRNERARERDEALLAGGIAPAKPQGANAADESETPAKPQAVPIEARCKELAAQHHLTAREEQILSYLAKGYGSGYIGEALYISPNTVRTHIHNIYRKINASSREEVIERVNG